jgi:hypothetical protein
MREYHIPGGSIVSDAPANLRDDLLVAHDAIGRSKAEGTWRRYLPLWRKARQYMTAKLLENAINLILILQLESFGSLIVGNALSVQ